MTFTFYDASGASIGTQDVTVPALAAAGTRQFRLDFYSDEKVHGYGYTVGM